MLKDMGNMMKQIQKMQAQMEEIQKELENKRVEGTAGGGMVKVVANGRQEILEIQIEPEVVNPNDVEMLQDLIVAAVNQARQKSLELMAEDMSKLTGGMKIPCFVCLDEKRDKSIICVVEEANDVLALEKTGVYNGLYHVLGGALSPLDGIGPDNLRVQELLHRLKEPVGEIILATNPNVEGEATAIYLSKLIKPLGFKVTRIARGLPVGGDLEYADQVTML